MRNPWAGVVTTEIDPCRRVVYRHDMRSRRGGLALVCLVLAACAHKPPPPPPPKPKPPAPKGDVLRFKYKEGESPKAQVKVVIDQELAGKQGGKGGGVHVAFT